MIRLASDGGPDYLEISDDDLEIRDLESLPTSGLIVGLRLHFNAESGDADRFLEGGCFLCSRDPDEPDFGWTPDLADQNRMKITPADLCDDWTITVPLKHLFSIHGNHEEEFETDDFIAAEVLKYFSSKYQVKAALALDANAPASKKGRAVIAIMLRSNDGPAFKFRFIVSADMVAKFFRAE